MPLPKSNMKIKKNGVEFVSNVDRVQYTIHELTRAALLDTAKFLRKLIITELKKMKGMKRHRRLYKSMQYWVRRKEADLIIGFKHDAWYGAKSELGDEGQPARGLLRATVMANIDEIRKIQGQYLSAIQDEREAEALINEEEHISAEGEE